MKVEFSPETRKIVIDDSASQQKQLLNLMWGCNLVIGILHIVNGDIFNMSVIDYFFAALVLMAIVGLVYNNFYISTGKTYHIEEIEGLKSSTYFNQIIYELVLKNGKKRRVHFGNDFESIEKLNLLLNEK